jgi:hypothetical protein
MPISRSDFPAISSSIEDLLRVLENPSPDNPTALRVHEWNSKRSPSWSGRHTGNELSRKVLIQDAMEQLISRMTPSGTDSGMRAPDIANSDIDLSYRAHLLEILDRIRNTYAISHLVAIRSEENIKLRVLLESVLRALGQADNPKSLSHRSARDPKQPSIDRQNDILAAIRAARTPLTRSELVKAMRLKSEGRMGVNLAWMVVNKILVNIRRQGYWPAGEPVPK